MTKSVWEWCVEVGVAIGGTIVSLLGGWDASLQVLIGFIAVDYTMGILCGIMGHSQKTDSGKLSSKAAFTGLIKKSSVLLMVGVAAGLDKIIGADFVCRTAVCLFFVASEGISILENYALITGDKAPAILIKVLEALKDKGEGTKNGSEQ
jgi:toxin secretion/phage lysis holin